MCTVKRVRSLFLSGYFALTLNGDAEPTDAELAELLSIAVLQARLLSIEFAGDAARYTVILNGTRSRRRRAFHIHILVSKSRLGKAWLHAVLSGKNFLQALGLRSDGRYSQSNTSPAKDLRERRLHEIEVRTQRDARLSIALLLFLSSATAWLVQAWIVFLYLHSALNQDWTYFLDAFPYLARPSLGPGQYCFDDCSPDLPFVAGWIGIASFLLGLLLLVHACWNPAGGAKWKS